MDRPAFPHTLKFPDGSAQYSEGMTLRDYFAGQASTVLAPPSIFMGDRETTKSLTKWARKTYLMADAMLKARE